MNGLVTSDLCRLARAALVVTEQLSWHHLLRLSGDLDSGMSSTVFSKPWQ